MSRTITQAIKDEGVQRILDNLGSAITQTGRSDWAAVLRRIDEARLVVSQLEGTEVEG